MFLDQVFAVEIPSSHVQILTSQEFGATYVQCNLSQCDRWLSWSKSCSRIMPCLINIGASLHFRPTELHDQSRVVPFPQHDICPIQDTTLVWVGQPKHERIKLI